jgi:hypothetical protein
VVDLSDLTPFAVTAPVDGRLPGGSGYPVTGLYDVVLEKPGQISTSGSGSRPVFIAPVTSTRAAARPLDGRRKRRKPKHFIPQRIWKRRSCPRTRVCF